MITRSKEGNRALAADLRRRGFNPIPVDTISFLAPRNWSAIDASLKDLGSYDWLVFTSATGVEFFARRMKKLSLKLPRGAPPSFAAVGKGTAARSPRWERYGLHAVELPHPETRRGTARQLGTEGAPAPG